MSKLRVEECIDRVNDIIDHAYVFFGRILVKQELLSEQIDRIRGALPEDINEASRILRRRQDILDTAKMEADRIVNEALKERDLILSDHEIKRKLNEDIANAREQLIAECEETRMKAYNDADMIKMQALENARRMKEGIDNYAEQVMNQIESDLAGIEASLRQQQTIVQNGQKALEQKKLEVQRTYDPEPVTQNQVNDYQQEPQEVYANY